MNDVEEMILLQRLQQHLAYFKYDQLGLSTLIKMRNEVYGRMQKLIPTSEQSTKVSQE